MYEFHLCQPDENKSCGACCGLYNYVDNSRDALARRLAFRSDRFARVRQGTLDLEDYRGVIRHREDGRRIFTTVYTCEFVGYVNAARTRVGCMLHPLANDGHDLRDKSFYGREICEGHFCPSYQKLESHESRIVIDTIDDWYLYGCVITDIDFVKTFFRLVQDELGECVDPRRIRCNPVLRDILHTYFALKLTWPSRDQQRPRFGKYYFVGEEYDIDRIDYASLGTDPSPFDAIFLSLSSKFKNSGELRQAEKRIEGLMHAFCHEYHNTN